MRRYLNKKSKEQNDAESQKLTVRRSEETCQPGAISGCDSDFRSNVGGSNGEQVGCLGAVTPQEGRGRRSFGKSAGEVIEELLAECADDIQECEQRLERSRHKQLTKIREQLLNKIDTEAL
jgi:hypothetical protein